MNSSHASALQLVTYEAVYVTQPGDEDEIGSRYDKALKALVDRYLVCVTRCNDTGIPPQICERRTEALW